jgi:hypothetical protein
MTNQNIHYIDIFNFRHLWFATLVKWKVKIQRDSTFVSSKTLLEKSKGIKPDKEKGLESTHQQQKVIAFVMKSHINCEIVWISIYKIEAILILQAVL